MTDPRRPPRDPNRQVIPATCHLHGGTPGFCNLVVRKINARIELNPHATGCCLLTLDEDGACVLRDALIGWLG